jgi:hypothetical protein
MGMGDEMGRVLAKMKTDSSETRWAKDRTMRAVKKQKTAHRGGLDPLSRMVFHLKEWNMGNRVMFNPDYVINHAYRRGEAKTRSFMLVLPSFDHVAKVANRLLHVETRTNLAFKKAESAESRHIPLERMEKTQMFVFRFPQAEPEKPYSGADSRPCMPKRMKRTPAVSVLASVWLPSDAEAEAEAAVAVAEAEAEAAVAVAREAASKAVAVAEADAKAVAVAREAASKAAIPTKVTTPTKTGANKTGATDAVKTKYAVMIFLPTEVPVSAVAFFSSMNDISTLGCVIPSHYNLMIAKTSWRSMQTYPVDNWGMWKHIGLGKDKDTDPFLMRLSVLQAST